MKPFIAAIIGPYSKPGTCKQILKMFHMIGK